MARPRAKKKKVSSGTHTRSVFLYGSPNAEKRSTLEKLQADYTDAVNFYISLLSDREECLLQLLQNDKKDPLLRKLEKESRIEGLSSAYSQNAFDEAVTKLHNRLDNIRKDVIAATGGSVFAVSILLFHAVLSGQSREEMCGMLARIRDSYKAKEKIQYYDKLHDTVKTMEEKEFLDSVSEVAMFYHIISDEYRIPVVKKAHVLSVTIPDRKRERMPCAGWNSMGYPVPCAIPSLTEDPLSLPVPLRRIPGHRKNIPQSSAWMSASRMHSIPQRDRQSRVSSLS